MCLVTILLMLAAPGWPRSSPLATRLLSWLWLARMLLLPSAVTPRVLVWLLHCEEGPWGGARDIVSHICIALTHTDGIFAHGVV